MKNKWIVLLLLVTMLFTMTACSSKTPATTDNGAATQSDTTGTTTETTTQAKEVDPATVVAKVNGTEITAGELQEIYDSTVAQVVMTYAQYYGYQIDPNEPQFVSQMWADVVNTAAEQLAMEQKLQEMGIAVNSVYTIPQAVAELIRIREENAHA